MIKIYEDILNWVPYYYVVDEIEVRKGVKKFERLCGLHKDRKEAEAIMKDILKNRSSEK